MGGKYKNFLFLPTTLNDELMNYKRFDNKIVLRLDAGDEICDSIITVAEMESVKLGSVSGIGGADELTLGIFNTEKKAYTHYELSGMHEITSLLGNITFVKGKPYVHLHLTAVDGKARIAAGHLLSAYVYPTAEVIIEVINGEIGRTLNESLGFNEMKVC